jgi:Dual specificity phosphatase, catalytic domain
MSAALGGFISAAKAWWWPSRRASGWSRGRQVFLRGLKMLSFKCARKGVLIFTILVSLSLWGCCASVSEPPIAGACSNRLDSSILNFCVVTPNILWRGARPDKDGAAWLIQNGVRTFVNLELILDDKMALLDATVSDSNSYEVGYVRLPDWEALTLLAPSVADDHVAHFLAIVSQEPKPIYVHCRCGTKRTSVMVAAYRVLVENVSEEDAIDEMRRYRGPWSNIDTAYIRALFKRRDSMRQRVLEWIPRVGKHARVICAHGACTVVED